MRNCIIVLILAALFAAYLVHTPLPLNLADRDKMQFVEPWMRLLYYFPNKALNYFGLYRIRVYWSRFVMASFAFLLKVCTTIGRSPRGIYKIEDILIDGVSVRVYVPSERFNKGAVFFMHGGGYVLFSVDVYDSLTRVIAIETGMTVLSVEYRLAPEHPYPAALQDCEKALFGFITSAYKTFDVDPSKIILAGDSAGGSLAAILSRKFKDDPRFSQQVVKAQVLIYPLTQFVDLQTPSYQYAKAITEGTSLLDADSLALWMLLYLEIDPSHIPYIVNNSHWHTDNFRERFIDYSTHLDHDHLPFDKSSAFYRKIDFIHGQKICPVMNSDLSLAIEKLFFDPDFAPLMAEKGALRGSPDTLVITCEFDVLRDDGYFYYRRLQNEGVKTKWIHYSQGFHGMLNFHPQLDLARQAVQDIARFINSTLSQ